MTALVPTWFLGSGKAANFARGRTSEGRSRPVAILSSWGTEAGPERIGGCVRRSFGSSVVGADELDSPGTLERITRAALFLRSQPSRFQRQWRMIG